MCKFFSFNSNGKGKYFYLDWKSREALLKNNPENYNPDSHSSIVKYFQAKGDLALGNTVEDKFNKFEYNPLTKEFKVDQINTKDDSKTAESWVKSLDFKTVVKPLIIKPLIHPFKDRNKQEVTEEDIQRLKEWSKVRASAEDNSVWYSVRDSVGYYVEYFIWNFIRGFVENSIWDSVWYSGYSLGYSVRFSVRDSAEVFRYAYTSSFFNLPEWKHVKHKKGVNPFQPAIDLWESGLVPSFDGKIWRLHGGPRGKVLFKISKEDLEER